MQRLTTDFFLPATCQWMSLAAKCVRVKFLTKNYIDNILCIYYYCLVARV